eukprot:scaffold19903_cov64-Phaeocystis_antarctica.AAC.9
MALTSGHTRVIDMLSSSAVSVGSYMAAAKNCRPPLAPVPSYVTVASAAPGYVVYARCCGGAAPPAMEKPIEET